MRTDKSLNIVIDAIERIELRGDKASQINIKRETKLSRATVRKYIDIIETQKRNKEEREQINMDYASKKREEWIDDKIIQSLLDAPDP